MNKIVKKSSNKTNDELIKQANKSSRARGAIGGKAVVPRVVKKLIDNKNASILDFGAGRDASHTIDLKNDGYTNVTAYEFGDNVNPNLHDTNALENKKYDVVYASNVLNTQGSESMLIDTLKKINSVLKKGGKFIFNFPREPRYGAYSKYLTNKDQTTFLISLIVKIFRTKNIIDAKSEINSKTPVYVLTK